VSTAPSSTVASRRSHRPRANHRKSKKARRSRACAACVFHGDDASHTEKERFNVTSYWPARLIRKGCPSGTPRSSSRRSRPADRALNPPYERGLFARQARSRWVKCTRQPLTDMTVNDSPRTFDRLQNRVGRRDPRRGADSTVHVATGIRTGSYADTTAVIERSRQARCRAPHRPRSGGAHRILRHALRDARNCGPPSRCLTGSRAHQGRRARERGRSWDGARAA
jgi:hypothetical protein